MLLELLLVAIIKLNGIEEYYKYKNIQGVHNAMHFKDKNLARVTVEAAKWYQLDPYLLTALINSESGYRKDVKHKNKYVKGISGIHTKHWPVPVDTHTQQVYSGAYILKQYMIKYDNDALKALTAYKGISNKGRKQARQVLAEYKELKGRK